MTPRILLTEDSPTQALVLQKALESQGFEVIGAKNAQQALILAHKEHPDAILSDVLMPDMDGFQLCRQLRSNAAFRETPIVLTSAIFDTQEDRDFALSLGADDYIEKDLAPADLAECLHQAIAQRQAQADHAERMTDQAFEEQHGERLASRLLSLSAELRQKNEDLERESGLLQALMDSTPDWIFFKDTESRFVKINPAHAELLGISDPQDAIGMSDFDFFPESSARAFYEEEQKIIRSEEPLIARVGKTTTKDGKAFWQSETKMPLYDEAGEVIGLVGISRDVTELKLAEARIKRDLQRLSALREIDTTITSSLDLQFNLKVILNKVTTKLNVDAAAILLLRPYGQVLEHAANLGFRTNDIARSKARMGEGYAGRAALEQRIISIADLGKVTDFPRASLLAAERFVAYWAAPLIAKGRTKGVLELYLRAPLNPDDSWVEFLEILASQTAIAVNSAEMFDQLERTNSQLVMAYETTLEGWARALELHDKELHGRTRQLADLTVALARATGLSDKESGHLRRGALLHDIGTMGIPDPVLRKPSSLDEEEWRTIRQHPAYAHELLAPIDFLRPALDVPYCHHEKWDGTGYPRGLSGEQIPLMARIFAVADVYDALCSDRPYRKAWPPRKALAYIREQAGKHFDPAIVEAFLELPELRERTRSNR